MAVFRTFVTRHRLFATSFGSLCVLAVGLVGYVIWTDLPPSAEPAALCAQSPQTVVPSLPWRFEKDQGDVGLARRWFDVSFDDSGWESSPPGEAWDPPFIGVAWYRATFAPPAEWGQAYLGVGRVDQTAQLWINGVKQDWDPTGGDATQIIELPAGQPSQISFRVVNRGGLGGIKQPVKVGRTPFDALPPDSYIRWLAATHPDWPMPGWARNDYFAWTFTGLPSIEDKALFGADGSVAPWPLAPNVSLWLYDASANMLLTPAPAFSLLDGSLPIPQATWTAAGLNFRSTLFRESTSSAIIWQASLSNPTAQPKSMRLLAVVRPLGFDSSVHSIFSAGFDRGARRWLGDLPGRLRLAADRAGFDRSARLWLNGQPFMQASLSPATYGAGDLAQVLEAARSGATPKAANLVCAPTGTAAAAERFDIDLQPGDSLDFSLTFPASPGQPFRGPRDDANLATTRDVWATAIGSSQIQIPDAGLVRAYEASLGYLLLAVGPNGPRPGPLEHAKVWVRDSAFVGEALLGAGYGDVVKKYLPSLFAYQSPDGRIPAIISSAGPEKVDEWDAQGEAIFLVADVYRFQHDLSFLRQWEPNVRNAAAFLRSLRARTQNDPPATRGLLPPSKSAEDLGDDRWHHYWDDFWAVTGFDEAAFIERELGQNDEATWMNEEATALRNSIRASVADVMGDEPAYIPGAPEDLNSSAMARSTSVSLFPLEVLPKDDPLIIRSFAAYYAKWIGPNDGAYKHIWGQYWPYGGLSLARDYLRLGQQDIVHRILAWTINHQTLPGTYAWAEQVSPTNGGISGGDMPHAWAASAYVTLIREMLAMRQGDKLELFAGVPDSWLDAGKIVGVDNAPTEFGSLTASVKSDVDTSQQNWQGTLTLVISGSARPPGGFIWKLPKIPTSLEGPPGAEIQNGKLIVPESGGVVYLRYSGQP